MTFSESHFKFSVKVEPNPTGGFIAHSEDPPFVIQGATREEVEGKLRDKIGEIAGANIALKLQLGTPGVRVEKKISFSIRKSGETSQHPSPSEAQIESTTPAAIEPSGSSSATLLIGLIALGLLLMMILVFFSPLRQSFPISCQHPTMKPF